MQRQEVSGLREGHGDPRQGQAVMRLRADAVRTQPLTALGRRVAPRNPGK
jgi:hypothetical protein